MCPVTRGSASGAFPSRSFDVCVKGAGFSARNMKGCLGAAMASARVET